MNFRDFYQPKKPAFSFEVFPPKTPQGIANLFSALKDLKKFDPAFVSVTYGAMGSTRDLTSDLAIRIQKEIGVTTAFHFTCVGSSRTEIRRYVEALKRAGIRYVVALRGDPPTEGSFIPPQDGFRYANELVAYLKEIDGFSLAVAGYPEGHIEAPDKETDLANLKRKVDAGADIVITQLFFDNRDYFDFVNRARKIGITVPIIPGIMPILNIKQVEKIAGMCGAKIPKDLHDRLLVCGEDTDAMQKIGIEHATQQCRDLLQKGAPGIHFYTLNRSASVAEILNSI